MNTKGNKRSRNTDEVLIRSFYTILQKKKSVSKVTVREICEMAGVNRSTFYAHYMDAYDLLESVEKTMAKNLTNSFVEALDKEHTIKSGFLGIFNFIYTYREFYKIYLNESSRYGVLALAKEMYQDRISSSLWREMGLKSEDEFYYQEEFYLAGISAMIRRWVNTGCKESPEEMFEILSHQYSPLFNWE